MIDFENFEISFSEIENEIYRISCEFGQRIAAQLLEEYDRYLSQNRDKRRYNHRGIDSTTVKTIFGEVVYKRRAYLDREQGGYIHLLDQAMGIDGKKGLFSPLMTEKIVEAASIMSYRDAAGFISRTTGQTVTHGAVWQVVQQTGEKINARERLDVRKMEENMDPGSKSVEILYEEMDGVWLKMQGPGHKEAKGAEMKVSTIYEGWDVSDRKRPRLVGKQLFAGMETSNVFLDKREAQIYKTYRIESIEQRVLNGDGGSWIADPYDPYTVKQLDQYHIQKAIIDCISDKAHCKEIRRLLKEQKIEALLEYITVYRDSLSASDQKDAARKVETLLTYFKNHKDSLKPWQSVVDKIPDKSGTIVYNRNMGVQENQNCTLITLRMKRGRMRWSMSGANNMGKVLYTKANHELTDTVRQMADGYILSVPIRSIVEKLSTAKTPDFDGRKDQKSTPSGHVPIRDTALSYTNMVIRSLLDDDRIL